MYNFTVKRPKFKVNYIFLRKLVSVISSVFYILHLNLLMTSTIQNKLGCVAACLDNARNMNDQ